jgi:ABC-type phosphate transport system substrate-binding protein
MILIYFLRKKFPCASHKRTEKYAMVDTQFIQQARKLVAFAFSGILLFLASLASAQEIDVAPSESLIEHDTIYIIANSQVDLDSISTGSLRSIFAMRRRNWPSGETVKVFVLADNNPTHVRFTKELLHTFPYNLRRIWDRRVFSGIGQYPTLLSSESEMMEKIASTTNAIGYIQGKYISDDVKLLVVKK